MAAGAAGNADEARRHALLARDRNPLEPMTSVTPRKEADWKLYGKELLSSLEP